MLQHYLIVLRCIVEFKSRKRVQLLLYLNRFLSWNKRLEHEASPVKGFLTFFILKLNSRQVFKRTGLARLGQPVNRLKVIGVPRLAPRPKRLITHRRLHFNCAVVIKVAFLAILIDRTCSSTPVDGSTCFVLISFMVETGAAYVVLNVFIKVKG